jgi:hypothetical protein
MPWLRTELQTALGFRSRALGPMLTPPAGGLWPGFLRFGPRSRAFFDLLSVCLNAASPTSDFCLSPVDCRERVGSYCRADKIMYPSSRAVEVFAPDRQPEEENAAHNAQGLAVRLPTILKQTEVLILKVPLILGVGAVLNMGDRDRSK